MICITDIKEMFEFWVYYKELKSFQINKITKSFWVP